MITDDDIKKLAQVFATKDDLRELKNFMQKEYKKLNKKLDQTIRFFDDVRVNHGKRIKRIETKLNLPPYVD